MSCLMGFEKRVLSLAQFLANRGCTMTSALVAVVYMCYVVDNILITVVVPIIPDVLGDKFERDFGGLPRNVSAYKSHRGLFQAKVGSLFASRSFVQLISNPIVGILTNRYGHKWFVIASSFIFLGCSAMYASSAHYAVLFIGRSLHGLGSACCTISGMAIVSESYDVDEDRTRAISTVLSGMAAGVFLGYPLGGFAYNLFGQYVPFLITGGLALLSGALCFVTLFRWEPIQKQFKDEVSYSSIACDKTILICIGAVGVSTAGIAVLEPCLPIWLQTTIKPDEWQIGLAFMPDSLGYLIGTNLFGRVSLKIGRWLCALVSLMLLAGGLFAIPFATHMAHLILPHFAVGLGIAVIDASLQPLLAQVMEVRYQAKHATVFALTQTTVSLAYFCGPFVGGWLMGAVGFRWVLWSLALVNLCYAPLVLLLRKDNVDGESFAILHESRRSSQWSEYTSSGRSSMELLY